MDLAALVAEPAVGQMRPEVVVVRVKMELRPVGFAVGRLEGLVGFAENLRSVQMHRSRLVEAAVQMGLGWRVVVVAQVPAHQRAVTPEGYSSSLVAQMQEAERRKHLVPLEDLELVLESIGLL